MGLCLACQVPDSSKGHPRSQTLTYVKGYAMEEPFMAVSELPAPSSQASARHPAEPSNLPQSSSSHNIPKWVENDRKVREVLACMAAAGIGHCMTLLPGPCDILELFTQGNCQRGSNE